MLRFYSFIKVAPCRIATTLAHHRLPFQSCSSQWSCHFGFFTEQHRSQVEEKSTVCGLPLWPKQPGYQLIGLMLLTAWFFLCGKKWCLRSCTNIAIKAAMRRASLKAALLSIHRSTFFHFMYMYLCMQLCMQ